MNKVSTLFLGSTVSYRRLSMGIAIAPVGILGPSDAETLAKRAYGLIGDEYYDASHITTRNFDAAISAFLSAHPPAVQTGCRYLEVGCGRSRLNRLGKSVQLVLMDLCRPMLQHSLVSGLNSTSTPLLGSAFALPFRGGAFRSAFSFLADPFFHPTYLSELRRVLIPGGHILQIVPSYDWGATLRSSRGLPIYLSHFFRGSREAFGPSFLIRKAEIDHLLRSAGFTQVHVTDTFVPKSVPIDKISPDILIPAKLRGVEAHELPILNVIEATVE